MTYRYALGNLGGYTRIRTARPGYEVTDMGLDPRFVSLDTQWRNVLRLVKQGFADSSAYATANLAKVWISGDAVGNYWHKVINVSGVGPGTHTALVLAKRKPVPGVGPGGQWYKCDIIIEPGLLRVSPPGTAFDAATAHIYPNNFEYAWYVFRVGTEGDDPVEAGQYDGLALGNHPTRGPGIFLPRRGVSVLTAGDDDLVVSTQGDCFQVSEAGFLGSSAGGTVTLSRSYPHRPPILVFSPSNGATTEGRPTERRVWASWLSDNQIQLETVSGTTCPFRWAIISTDPSYVPGVGSILVNRCVGHPSIGFGVTKKDIDFFSAGENDWIFRSDRMLFQFRSYHAINPGAAGSGWYSYPTPATSGVPFVFFQISLAGSTFVNCGSISSQGIFGAVIGSPSIMQVKRYFVMYGANASQYYFGKAPDITYPGGVNAFCGIVNVSDF
ncbi:hypothetical protein [Ancylobacter moscoviensis]